MPVLFGLVKFILSYQNMKNARPKGYHGFWNVALHLVCFALKTAEHSLLIHNQENIENKKIIATLNYTV